METIEKKVIPAILTLIRARRESASIAESDAPVSASGPPAPAKLREALFSDYSAVTQLKERWGLIPDSMENWERLWRHSPALMSQADRPIGWVLEANGKTVGYLGNVTSLYRYGNRTLTAVTGSGLVVEPAYRAFSMSLVAAYYRQPSVDLFLTTTAVEAVGKIAKVFKSDPLPQPDYETVLFWVLRPHPFARAVMERLEFGPTLSRVTGALVSAAVGADKILRGRWPRGSSKSLSISEIRVDEIGQDFENLWAERLSERLRLFADRSPETLRWHFDIPGDRGTTRVLCCHRGKTLVGYAVVRNQPHQPNGLRRSMIADMLASQDDEAVLKSLWVAAYNHARRAGSHVLEVLGFPENIRQVGLRWNPYLRKFPSCPFYYKAADPLLHKELSRGSAWYASPFDGDGTIMP